MLLFILVDDILDILFCSDEYCDLVGDDYFYFYEKGFCVEKDKYCMYSDFFDLDLDEDDDWFFLLKKCVFWNKVFVFYYCV